MLNNQIEVSIVFPTYNRIDEVKFNIEYLRKNIKISYELIILDNSPIEAKFDLLSNECYIFLNENMGTASRNIGIEKAKGKYILLLDDDSHPLPGVLEKAIEQLRTVQNNIAGITSEVQRSDGGLENPPLLPTAFHGCGVLFKAHILKNLPIELYPLDFCFYGEEYWSTALLYSQGYELKYSKDFKVCHRMNATGRDKGKILYYLTRNNQLTWEQFIPKKYLENILFDTNTRYKLIANKENVSEYYNKAINEKVQNNKEFYQMTVEQFKRFTLLDRFENILKDLNKISPIILCGCGKFPTLWWKFLEQKGFINIKIFDLNAGLIGQKYENLMVGHPDNISYSKNIQFIVGHTSRVDTNLWKKKINSNYKTIELNLL